MGTAIDAQDGDDGLAVAERFFGGLLAGDLAALQAVCAPDAVLWIMTERYLNEPVGELGYWRAAIDYDCAEPQPAQLDAAAVSIDVGGGENTFILRDEHARSFVLRLTVDADGDGSLGVKLPGGAVVEPSRINFSKGINELFFKVDRVQPADRFTVESSTRNFEVKTAEARAAGCLADSATARATTAGATSAPSADH
jgi:hypothetical protein